jgi:PAS domain S-box-containing protein
MDFVSRGCLALTGYGKEELEDSRTVAYGELVAEEDVERVRQTVREALKRYRHFTILYRIRTRAGKLRWVWEQGVGVYSSAGELLHIEGFVTDINEQMETRRQLERALEEKDFLMRELNHRVKNNLSLVNSLIATKEATLGEDADFSDLTGRIDAIRIVHEKLYQSDEITHINMRDYVDDLLATIFSSLSDRSVAVENEVEVVYVPTKIAIPLGLIVNEVATNAIKHGFEDVGTPRFRAEMRRAASSDAVYDLTLSNNGAPIPEDIDLNRVGSLGLRLTSLLAEQIGGSLELQKRPSPSFTIRFALH